MRDFPVTHLPVKKDKVSTIGLALPLTKLSLSPPIATHTRRDSKLPVRRKLPKFLQGSQRNVLAARCLLV